MTLSFKFKLLICSFIFLFSSASYAFGFPTRAIRLADLQGEVSFLPAGEKRWATAIRNRTLYIGDSLWNDVDSLSMLELDGSKLCIGSGTSIKILNLNDNLVQVQLNQGSALLYVKRLKKNQEIEINTPNLAFVVKKPGVYRLIVASDGKTTVVHVKQGFATLYGVKKSFSMSKNQSAKFKGTNLKRMPVNKPVIDPLEKWCNKHTVEPKKRVTIRYVSEDVVGYDDLDEYGSWREIKGYGFAWTPTEVRTGWSPYRYGRWLWIDPWGWTWVGDEPWGYTPYHYGRWVFVEHHWYWVPGPKKARAVYAPALVVFANVGKDNVSWFPLGPGEVYRPAYQTSEAYFYAVNTSNTVVKYTTVQHMYRQPQTRIQYRNNEVAAVTTVHQKSFQQAKPTSKSQVVIKKEDIANASTSNTAAVAPKVESVLGAEQETKAKPAEQVTQRETIAVTKAAEPAVSFEEKQDLLEKQEGKPLDPEQIKKLAEENKVEKEKVKVIEIEQPISLPEAATQEEQAQDTQKAEEPKVELKEKEAVKESVEGPVPSVEKQPVQEQPEKAQEVDQAPPAQQAVEKEAEQPQQQPDEDAQQLKDQRAKEEAAKQAEEQQRAQEEAQRHAEEQQRAQEEAQRHTEEQQRAQEEARQRAEEQQRAQEEARQRAEEQQRAKEEADRKAAEEAARKQSEQENVGEPQQE